VPEFAPAGEAGRGAAEAWRLSQADGSNAEAFAGIAAAIRRREFLKSFDWRRAGWVERFMGYWLTPRERVLAEFLSGGEPQSAKKLLRLGLALGGFALLINVFPGIIAAVTPFSLLLLFFLPKIFYRAAWPGAALRNVGGNNIAICAGYPVGYQQIARVTIKTNLARLAVIAPFLAVAGFLFMRGWNLDLIAISFLSAKIVAGLLGLALLGPVVLVTAGTNDGTKWRLVLLTIIWLAAGMAACVFLAAATDWMLLGAAAALFIGLCAAALAVYGRAYDNNWFDLQLKPKETLGARRQ
jgi:hypothetical protein